LFSPCTGAKDAIPPERYGQNRPSIHALGILGDDTEKFLVLRNFPFLVAGLPLGRVSVDFTGFEDVSFTSASIAKVTKCMIASFNSSPGRRAGAGDKSLTRSIPGGHMAKGIDRQFTGSCD
jgi:hypothetical protein